MTTTGDPSSDKLAEAPVWESYEVGRRRLIITRGNDMHSASAMGQFTEELSKRCRYWMSERVTAETRV